MEHFTHKAWIKRVRGLHSISQISKEREEFENTKYLKKDRNFKEKIMKNGNFPVWSKRSSAEKTKKRKKFNQNSSLSSPHFPSIFSGTKQDKNSTLLEENSNHSPSSESTEPKLKQKRKTRRRMNSKRNAMNNLETDPRYIYNITRLKTNLRRRQHFNPENSSAKTLSLREKVREKSVCQMNKWS